MYDDSTKQVQDVEVGDIVKSYLPVGMPDEFFFDDWLSYSSTDLSGSVASGSIVIRTLVMNLMDTTLVNGSIKMARNKVGGKIFLETRKHLDLGKCQTICHR